MFTKTTGRALYREVVNQICQMILSGRLKKGDLLPSEQKLCEQMGVSRTTIREALRILKERGIIESIKGKGSVVLSDDFSYVDESVRASLADFKDKLENAVQARLLLEPQIAKLACENATKQDLQEMQEILAICDQKEKAGNLTSKDLRMFHFKVAESTHNPILRSLVEMLISLCDAPEETGVRAPHPEERSVPEINISHGAVFAAISENRPEDAYFYMKENIKQFYRNTLRNVSEES